MPLGCEAKKGEIIEINGSQILTIDSKAYDT